MHNIKSAKSLCLISLLILLNWGTLFSQDEKTITGPAVSVPRINEDQEMDWKWGQAVAVDPLNNLVTIKYLDYDTDTEKEMLFYVDEKTVFENAKSLNEIKPGESLSIDYSTAANGKNIARIISLEKAEPPKREEETQDATSVSTDSPEGNESPDLPNLE